MANENKMGYLPIKKLILQMSLPPMCSMFLQYSYNLVDSMFVANINENALAAVSLSFPITTLMISCPSGLGSVSTFDRRLSWRERTRPC